MSCERAPTSLSTTASFGLNVMLNLQPAPSRCNVLRSKPYRARRDDTQVLYAGAHGTRNLPHSAEPYSSICIYMCVTYINEKTKTR